jgi:hypothetical protein
MDLHKKYLQVAVVDEKGRVLRNSKIREDLAEVGKFFNDVNNQLQLFHIFRRGFKYIK